MIRYCYKFLKKTRVLYFFENIRLLIIKIDKHDILYLNKKALVNIFFGTFGGISILIGNYYFNINKKIFVCNYKKKFDNLKFTTNWINKDFQQIIILSVLEAIILEDDIENSQIEYPDYVLGKKYVCLNNNNTSDKYYFINKAGGFFHFYLEVIPKLLDYVKKDFNINFIIEEMSFYKEILNFYDIKYIENLTDTSKKNNLIKMNKFYPSAEDIIKLYQVNSKFSLEGGTPRFIYITRRNERARRVHNEKDLIKFLNTLKFEVVDPGNLSFIEQIRIFRNAEVIIAPHGAALSNIIWCRENTRIIELNGENDVRWHFAKVASVLKFKHTLILGKTINSIYFETPINVIKKLLSEI